MARPFSLTMRSMKSDHPKTVMLFLIITTIVLFIWNIWFFGAKLPVYELSIQAKVTKQPEKRIRLFSGSGRSEEIKQNEIVASFPMSIEKSIARNQRGLFFPVLKKGQISEAVDCVVEKILVQSENKVIQARLKTMQPKNRPVYLQPGMSGLIKLEIDRCTPFEMLIEWLRSS